MLTQKIFIGNPRLDGGVGERGEAGGSKAGVQKNIKASPRGGKRYLRLALALHQLRPSLTGVEKKANLEPCHVFNLVALKSKGTIFCDQNRIYTVA
jgi:hypothetical protein